MSKLESIVPPLELCKQIPAGEFEDSALVWVEDEDGIELVMPREVAQYEHDEMIPAPTPEEIIIEIGKTHKYPKLTYCYNYWDITSYTGSTNAEIFWIKPEPTASEVALRLWFKVKGIELK